jgi:nucleoside-diphosphate-sugar epimerase
MLLKRGHEVVGLDTDYFSACSFAGTLADIEILRLDVRQDLNGKLNGFDAVIHLAGLSNDPLGDYRPNITEQINVQGSLNLAQAARQAGVSRFLFASSCSTYGASDDNFLTEQASFNPVTAYGKSKVMVEQALGELADKSFCPTYLRASTAYGLSPRLRFDLVVNNLTAWAFTTGRVRLKSDGTPWRPIVHVEDISRAYIAALEAPLEHVYNQAFNIGTTTENYQIKEIAQMVEAVVPGCHIDFAEDAGPDKRCYRVDCNKIATQLHGFKPQWTAQRGIEQLYQAYQEVGLVLDDFEGPRYMRIAHIKQLIERGRLDADLYWR